MTGWFCSSEIDTSTESSNIRMLITFHLPKRLLRAVEICNHSNLASGIGIVSLRVSWTRAHRIRCLFESTKLFLRCSEYLGYVSLSGMLLVTKRLVFPSCFSPKYLFSVPCKVGSALHLFSWNFGLLLLPKFASTTVSALLFHLAKMMLFKSVEMGRL